MTQPTGPLHPQEEPLHLGDHDGYPVYPMPVFARVEATDPEATLRWFTDTLDFGVVFTGPEVGGVASLVHLRRAKYQDVLVVPSPGPVSDGGSLTLTLSVGEADDVDRLARRIQKAGDQSLEGPTDTPWNTRELSVQDPDGNRYTLTGRGRRPMGDFPLPAG